MKPLLTLRQTRYLQGTAFDCKLFSKLHTNKRLHGYNCNRNRFASSGSANRMAGKRLETDAYVNSEATYIRTDLIPILM